MATITATATAPHPPAEVAPRVVLHGITWATFLALAEEAEEAYVRKAYNDGVLELMSPGVDHEASKGRMRRLVETLAEELDVACRALGSTLWTSPAAARGVEPDECFILTAARLAALGGRLPSGAGGPYPDLVIEVDRRRSAVDRPAIYAGLGVAEIWRLADGGVEIDRLRPDGRGYEPAAASGFFPIGRDEVARWVGDPEGDDNAWSRRLRAWIDAEVRPRRAGGV